MSFPRRLRERGQTLPIVVVFMVVTIALAGTVIDIGNVERVRGSMQNAADAAATGGASTLPEHVPSDPDVARTRALELGMGPQGANQVDGVDLDSITQNINVHCDTAYSGCSDTTGPNTVTVHDSASVSTFFLRLLGIDEFHVSVDAEACAPCSAAPHDIMLVLDRSGSMDGQGKGSSSSHSKLDNLKAGLLQGFLTTLNPDVDRVGVALFPPNTATSGSCSPKDHDVDTFRDPTRSYLALAPVGSFVDDTGTPNTNSPLVQLITCITAAGGTDYADPLRAAQAELEAAGRPSADKVIVLISDGGATESDDPRCGTAAGPWACNHPCSAGIDEANAIKMVGTEIYSIAYGNFGDDELCGSKTVNQYTTTEPGIDGYQAMTQIASPGDYLADPDPANLKGILKQVSGEITGGNNSRLVK